MLPLLAAALVFFAVTAVALGIFGYAAGSRSTEQRLRSWFRQPRRHALEAGEVLRRQASTFPALRSLLADSAWTDRAALELEQAALRLRVSEYLLLRLLAGVVGALLMALLLGGFLGLLLALPVGVLGFMLPAFYVRFRRERRTAAINHQLVETLQLISNGLRSGFAFTQAVEMAATQLASPMRDELEHFLKDNALGERVEDALRAVVRRTGSYDLDIVVTAILVQRTTGGNLAEVLDKVGETISERERVQREIRSLTASQRLTGLILSVYPVFLGAVFFLLAPSFMSVLFTDPAGRIALAFGLALQVIGAYAMRRILAVDY